MIDVRLSLDDLKEIRRGLFLRSQEIEVYDNKTEETYNNINKLYDKIERLESELEEVE
jgi:peptidoglycan hydrolase CwlO-like protein